MLIIAGIIQIIIMTIDIILNQAVTGVSLILPLLMASGVLIMNIVALITDAIGCDDNG